MPHDLVDAKGKGQATNASNAQFVLVVDDDAAVREALGALISSMGIGVRLFGSATELLEDGVLPEVTSCIILDVRLPGISGLDFQASLWEANIHLPVIFISGHGDVPMSVRAMKGGAVDFLVKPFRDQDLLDAIGIALTLDRKRRQREAKAAVILQRAASLTTRERQVLGHVTNGLLNKQIAVEMGLSEMTVKIHRRRVMEKMQAGSIADLVKMSQLLTAADTGVARQSAE